MAAQQSRAEQNRVANSKSKTFYFHTSEDGKVLIYIFRSTISPSPSSIFTLPQLSSAHPTYHTTNQSQGSNTLDLDISVKGQSLDGHTSIYIKSVKHSVQGIYSKEGRKEGKQAEERTSDKA